MLVKFCSITDQAISAIELSKLVESDSAGAIVAFSGNVRVIDSGKRVNSLTYEVHPSAQKVLEEIIDELSGDSGALAIAAAHRHGEIPIGQAAFVVAVAAEHRKEAFDLCSQIVERVKERLPIWKYQSFEDGTSEWVNSA